MVFLLAGCEVIKEEDRLIPVPAGQSSTRRHVLLEFTGFRCVNCPTASEIAEELQAYYGESLLIVSLHPASNPFTQGKYDYTCQAADSIYLLLGGTETTPFPAGNIDMKPYKETSFTDMQEWATMTYQAMQDTVAPHLSAKTQADSVTREVKITIDHNTLTNTHTENWLVEDSVTGPQAMPDGTINMTYNHRHILRAATKGNTLRVPDECRWEQCRIITLLIDNNTNQILQANETTLDFRTDY